MGQPEVRVLPDLATLSVAAAAEIASIARASVAARGRFTIALAGGNTPRQTYELLAVTHRDAIDWTRIDLVFGDERLVPHDDARSNYRMVREALVNRVPITADRVHPVPTDIATPEEAAEQYEATLRRVLADHTTDAGGADPVTGEAATVELEVPVSRPDRHTASLRPGSRAHAEQHRCASAYRAPTTVHPPVPRNPATLPFLDGARADLCLVAGPDKRRVISEILGAQPSA